MEKKQTPAYKVAGIIWIISVLVFGVLLSIKTDLFRAPLQEVDFTSDRNFVLAITFTVLLSLFSFAFAVFDILGHAFERYGLHNPNPSFRVRLGNSIKFFFFVALFTLFLTFMIFNPVTFLIEVYKKRKEAFAQLTIERFIGKMLQIILVLSILLPLWIGGYYIAGTFTYQTVKHRLGYYVDAIPIAGTGSMYPTF